MEREKDSFCTLKSNFCDPSHHIVVIIFAPKMQIFSFDHKTVD